MFVLATLFLHSAAEPACLPTSRQCVIAPDSARLVECRGQAYGTALEPLTVTYAGEAQLKDGGRGVRLRAVLRRELGAH